MSETTRFAFQPAVQHPVAVSSRANLKSGFDWFDGICVVALLLSFVFISRLPFGPSKYSDGYFHEEAKQVARVIRGIDPWRDIQIARAPGPVLYYAAPYLLVPTDSRDETYWRFGVAWNALWMLVAVLLIRRTGDLLAGDRAGKIAAALCLILPFGAYYSFGISAETPACVASAVFAYGWARWRMSQSSRLLDRASLIALAGLIGLLFCRPNALIVVGIAAVCGFNLWKRHPGCRLAEARFAVLCVATSHKASPSQRKILPKMASQIRAAFSSMVANTG